jgi:hypothetical protein
MKISIVKKIVKKLISKKKIKVGLFVVGAQKSGTSSLHNFLIKHNSITGGKSKEINFFNHEEKYLKGYGWYHSNFDVPLIYRPERLFLDSTPQYLSDLRVAQKIYSYNSVAKIVILLREPVSRAYSAWNMYKQFSEMSPIDKQNLIKRHISSKDTKKFNQFINQVPFPDFEFYVNCELKNLKLLEFYPNILRKSIYYDQVEKYINYFGKDNVLIFDSDFFKQNKGKVVNRIVSHCQLSFEKLEYTEFKNVHERKYDAPIDLNIKEKLKTFYKPYNEKLFTLINQKFDW